MDDQEKTQRADGRAIGIARDLIMTAWIVIVAIAYFGGLVDRRLTHAATILSPGYALMLMLSVVSLALSHSRHKGRPVQ